MSNKELKELKKICFKLKIQQGLKIFNVVAIYKAIRKNSLNKKLNKLKLKEVKIEKEFANKTITRAVYDYLIRKNLLSQIKIIKVLRIF